MNSLLLQKDGTSKQIEVIDYLQLKNLTLPNTVVTPLNDGVHLLIHSGRPDGLVKEINDIATILLCNGSKESAIVFGDAVITDVKTFYELQ
jgi:hypothetical protein